MNDERYLDPPDEPEADYCEDCGQEMVENSANYKASMPDFRCLNPFCPAQFSEDGDYSGDVVKDMAQKLVEVTETLKSTQSTLKYVRTKLSHYEDIISAREDSIASLERQIIEYQRILTLGQSNLVERVMNILGALKSVCINEGGLHPVYHSHFKREIEKVKKLLTNL